MFDRILVANRGEIAARIIRTCKEMGIHTIAVYSEADEGAPHTELADEAHLIGPAHVAESYLDIQKILDVAQETGAEAIHPGYGLLSENTEFVEEVERADIVFIGPRSEVMQLMGDKADARAFAESAGVPVVPGSDGPIAGEEEAVEFAKEFGYPVLVKAAAGGGGIGMKIATNEKKLRKAVKASKRRAQSSFGDDTIYIERYVQNPRHIEIQVLADDDGKSLHFFERECSVQRRHQKVIEEAPSPAMAQFDGLRQRMTTAALALVDRAEYTNAGTVEFIVDADGNFFFIEMNTRLQVEHTITEEITGVDLVEQQIRIAFGESIQIDQDDLSIDGHAIECRVYAENPDKSFMPSPGTIGDYSEPVGHGIRVDSGVNADFEVTPYYDPMVAKVIAHGEDRTQAIKRMRHALENYVIEELTTNIDMHLEVLRDEEFLAGDVHTGWLESR
ncbi:MAG: acetyl/propionyl/methylcrotonyl-CoA carboxylase subunit alpha [Persicimonas sp.]